jgi:hypothetical protein
MKTDAFEEVARSGISRRKIVKTGGKLAYAVPMVAASTKLTGSGATAQVVLSPVGIVFCGHSTIDRGDGKGVVNTFGCKQACVASGCSGDACNVVCGNGQNEGNCPVGQGGDNPCCSLDFCVAANFTCIPGTGKGKDKTKDVVVYTGATCTV